MFPSSGNHRTFAPLFLICNTSEVTLSVPNGTVVSRNVFCRPSRSQDRTKPLAEAWEDGEMPYPTPAHFEPPWFLAKTAPLSY